MNTNTVIPYTFSNIMRVPSKEDKEFILNTNLHKKNTATNNTIPITNFIRIAFSPAFSFLEIDRYPL